MQLGIIHILTVCCVITLAVITSAVVLCLITLWFFVYFTTGVCTSTRKMNGRTVIITGCTSGIGKETARDLATRGAKVIMACRNLDTANKLRGKEATINNYKFISRKMMFEKCTLNLQSAFFCDADNNYV